MAEKETKKESRTYDVENLAKDLGIQPASVRVALRKADIERPGRAYEWSSRKEYDAVLAKLKEASSASDKKEPAKAPAKSKAEAAKPAAKKKAA
jgi:hypothetical protein